MLGLLPHDGLGRLFLVPKPYIYIYIYGIFVGHKIKVAVTSTGGSRNWVEWPRKVQANRVNYFASPIDMFAKRIEK